MKTALKIGNPPIRTCKPGDSSFSMTMGEVTTNNLRSVSGIGYPQKISPRFCKIFSFLRNNVSKFVF